MFRLSSALAALAAVAHGKTQAEIDNECYDFWNKLEESGVGQFDELNTNIGAGINAGTLTSVGTGTGMNFGRNHIVHVAENGNFGVGVPQGDGGADTALNTGIGAGVNLKGAMSTAVESGVGINQQGAISNVDLYKGNLNDLHIPGFNTMNGGVGQAGNLGNGAQGVIHRLGEGFGVAFTGLRRRMMENQCGPPPAKGGEPVSCTSTGDPHLKDFHGRRFDHQAFGEFIFYQSWAPKSHHPHSGLRIHVRNGPYDKNPRVATNHGIAIAGRLTCGNKYEIHKTGSSHEGVLKIRRRNGQVIWAKGKNDIYRTLSQETCPPVQIKNGVAHFIFEQDEKEDKTTLRVQIMNYGLNLGLDVLGKTVRMDTDLGVCTKNAGWDMQLECPHSIFTWYPTGSCATLSRGGENKGPAKRCPTALYNQAAAKCGKCPETVFPKGCIYDVCTAGDISAIDEILGACNVGIRLPKRINVGVGVGINMEGATSINAGRGVGINYGVNNIRVIDG